MYNYNSRVDARSVYCFIFTMSIHLYVYLAVLICDIIQINLINSINPFRERTLHLMQRDRHAEKCVHSNIGIFSFNPVVLMLISLEK